MGARDCRVLLSSLAASLVAACAASPIVDPGFESALEGKTGGWRASSALSQLTVDEAHHHSGRSSIRIEKKPGEGFADVLQSIDAAPWRGKTISLTAYLRSEGVSGTNGIWLRADGADRKMLVFADSYSLSLAGMSDWVERRAVLRVPPEAARLYFGAVMSSEGSLWADDFALSDFDPRDARPLSPVAEAYLREAEAKIREHAYFSSRVDWDAAESDARLLAAGAQSTAGTYPAIRFLLGALGDHHSHFNSPAATRDLRESTRIDFQIDGSVHDGIGYIGIPGFDGSNPQRIEAFRTAIRRRIDESRASNACAWIVDLRRDTGGNMYPMLDGLAPLLGDGTLGYFVFSDGRRVRWYLENGRTRAGPVPATAGPMRREAPAGPVAILTGPRTASSGEAVVVSFRGLANARSFGQPTWGNSSGNQTFAMSDGATIALTTSMQSDRTSRVFGGAIPPDQEVASRSDAPLPQDPVMQAAVKWLADSGCSG